MIWLTERPPQRPTGQAPVQPLRPATRGTLSPHELPQREHLPGKIDGFLGDTGNPTTPARRSFLKSSRTFAPEADPDRPKNGPSRVGGALLRLSLGWGDEGVKENRY
jgi:hypothetical protein